VASFLSNVNICKKRGHKNGKLHHYKFILLAISPDFIFPFPKIKGRRRDRRERERERKRERKRERERKRKKRGNKKGYQIINTQDNRSEGRK